MNYMSTCTLLEANKVIQTLAEGIRAAATTAASPTPTKQSPAATTTHKDNTKSITGKRKRATNDEEENEDESGDAFAGLCIGVNAVTRAATAGEEN